MNKEYLYKVCTRCMTYNHASYIEETLNGFSIQETTFPVVYIIVDDASDDGEQDVLKKWADANLDLFEDGFAKKSIEEYGELIVARHRNKKNLHFVILLLKENHYSKGKSLQKLDYIKEWTENSKYHAFCEGDDYWIVSDKLQQQVVFLEKNPDFSMSHTGFYVYYEREKRLDDDKKRADRCLELNNSGDVDPEKLINGYYISTATVMYRMDLYNQLKNWDPFLFGSGAFLMGDTQRWFGMRKMGKIHYLNKTTTVYRKHTGSATMQTSFIRNIRFTLSSWELNYYLSYKYGFSEKQKQLSSRELGRYLAIYGVLDPQYKSKISDVLILPVDKRNKYILVFQEYWKYLKNRIKRLLVR